MITEVTKVANFQPVTIKITFETQEELDLFGSLCNHVALTDLGIMPDYRALKGAGANTARTREVMDRILASPCLRFPILNVAASLK